ncbi:major capsid protein [Flyfo microvirus Tbat2_105]|nr:major capsid protein [Flyfo microvirus Tbat2_105]
MAGPNSISNNRTRTEALVAPRTMRRQGAPVLTSLPAGKMVPISAYPILREDAVRSGRLRFSFEQMETAEVLMNAIKVRVMAYFVPMLALERFNGSMDQLNLSYEGKPPLEGQPIVPYIELAPFGAHGSNAIAKYLGLHGQAADTLNTAYWECYNQIWNFRAKNRSPDLTLRDRLDTTLAPAFWAHERFAHMVPDFDQAVIDGEVPLNVVDARMPVRGLGFGGAIQSATPNLQVRESDGSGVVYPYGYITSDADKPLQNGRVYLSARSNQGLPDIFAELQQNGITVSLSNIELARKTQAFAKLRQQYNQHEDHIINLLMDAISIPEQAFKQPMLLADKQTIFGQSKRYASDAGNLTESVVNGMTQLEMSIQLPRVNVGGMIMVVAEITPDQLFERQADPWLSAKSVDDLPQYLRDTLDPEKVDVVKNSRIDASHSNPNGTFAYEPMNGKWNIDAPRVGGDFYRPTVNTGFDEKRQRIWAVETLNPTLSTDFYLCTNMHTKPFVVTNQDPFEVVQQGDVFIEGNTVFGGHLVEATDDYEKVLAVAPQDRINKEA